MIPRKQIGWSQESNLLWEISRQLDRIINQMCVGPCPTTTTTTENPCRQFTLTFLVEENINISGINCEGEAFTVSIRGGGIIIGQTYDLCAFSVEPSEQYSVENIGPCTLIG
jgi:hypothetical protein